RRASRPLRARAPRPARHPAPAWSGTGRSATVRHRRSHRRRRSRDRGPPNASAWPGPSAGTPSGRRTPPRVLLGPRAPDRYCRSVRPLIGITCYARGGHRESFYVPTEYVDAIRLAGGAPMLLPPIEGEADVLEALDALVLPGGGDIDPVHYGDDDY